MTRTSRPAPPPLHLVKPEAISERIPPYDLNAEAGTLGSMIIDAQCIGGVMQLVPKAELFFDDRHQVVYRIIRELFDANSAVDGMLVFSALKTKKLLSAAGGQQYFEQLVNSVPSSAHAEYYAAIVREKAKRREVITACNATLREAYDGTGPSDQLVDSFEQRAFTVAADGHRQQQGPETLADVLHAHLETIIRDSAEGSITGLPTGFIELDNLTCGLQAGEFIVIAARPSVGKTALALGIAEHAGVDLHRPAAVFSLEMSKQQLAQRLLCSRAGVDSHRVRRCMLTRDDRDRLQQAVGELAGGEVFIDDTPGLTLMDIRTKCRQLKAKRGLELVIVDYIQLMEAGTKSDNRTQEISVISRGLKGLARELNVPVIGLSQLNRSSETEGRLPRTSDLRESGAIEQDADTIMLLHREAVFHRGDTEWMDANPDKINEAIVIVAKQRMGPCDNVKLSFLASSTRFANRNPGTMF